MTTNVDKNKEMKTRTEEVSMCCRRASLNTKLENNAAPLVCVFNSAL